MARKNNKGRTSSAPSFVMLRYDILDSQAWLSLNPASRCVLLQIMRLYNGQNNGFLGASVRVLASQCNCTTKTVCTALNALIKVGFIERTREGSFSCKAQMAAEYRLMWLKCDKTERAPKYDFKNYNPAQSSDKEA